MGWWSKFTGKVTRREFEALERKVNQMALKVSELAGALTGLEAKLGKIQAEVEALKNSLGDVEIPAEAQASLDRLSALAQAIDDLNPDATQ